MSTPIELWKSWEGRIADGKFSLRLWLGGSDHSTVFLTEQSGSDSPKAAIKLIRADSDENEQLSRWADAAKLSSQHLIRLFGGGSCTIDDTRVFYVVMEYAEENLSEILPVRPLSPEEASEMLSPTAEALAYLHQNGLVHSCIKPSNIMAVANQLKISADGLRGPGESTPALSAYDAPECVTTGPSFSADIWSLGATLVAVLTQNEPKSNRGAAEIIVPATIPQPLGEILKQCLRADPRQRCTASSILSQLRAQSPTDYVPVDVKPAEKSASQKRPKRWMVVPVVVVVLFLMALLGTKLMVHQKTAAPVAETHAAAQPAEVPAARPPAMPSENTKATPTGVVRGSALHQVMPDVSRNAQRTIQGRIKVSVQVAVDVSGNVSEVKFVSAGPSKYFANQALVAARRWKFNPPQIDGRPVTSEWLLRYQFGRGSTQVFASEIKP
jgi:TonB family protein